MPGPWPRYQARKGPYRVVAARLPVDHAVALRAFASRTNQPIQAILKALVADWVKVNQHVNEKPGMASPPAVPVAPALPARSPAYQGSGKSLPPSELVALDDEREAAKDGKSFTD